MNLITEWLTNLKQTLIIVTHDVEIADYAHRVVYLRDGHIEKITENENIIKGQ